MEWVRQFVQELGFTRQQIEIGVDDNCAMHLLAQGTRSLTFLFWVEDPIDEGVAALKYIPFEELVTDMLTKATIGVNLKYLRKKLLGEGDEDNNA